MVTLIILDGFGESKKVYGNAIAQAGTPNLEKLKAKYPHTTLKCHGESVGLEEGQMGGSEVGHLNIGAGKVVFQDLSKINNAIKNKSFLNNSALKKAMEHAKIHNSKLHLLGLLSDGGIHSKMHHLEFLVDMAEKYGLKQVFIHAFMDGRDTLKDEGIKFIRQIENHCKGKAAKIASICGRIYAMDREKRYDRLQKAYDMLIMGQSENYFQSAEEAILQSYEKKIFDEFVEPTIIGKPQKIESNDSVIFFNYRSDRAREITQAITQQNIKEMQLVNLKNLCYVCFTQYSEDFKGVEIAIMPEVIKNNLSKIIADNNLKQFHISETTKYAHVTFFLNGGIEKANIGEDRKLIESHDVKDYSTVPNMKAIEICNETIEAISKNYYDFIIVNFSNADMLGHTGNIEATKQAITCVDKCAYLVTLATLAVGGDTIITADHGNADAMLDDEGNTMTAHSLNPVPFILISEKNKNAKLKSGKSLTSIAPTVLKLLGIKIPPYMDEPMF